MITNTETESRNVSHPSINELQAFRAEAATAGDHDAVALCDLAMDGVIALGDHPHISRRLAARLVDGAIDGTDASIEVAAMIESARAMDDSQAVRS